MHTIIELFVLDSSYVQLFVLVHNYCTIVCSYEFIVCTIVCYTIPSNPSSSSSKHIYDYVVLLMTADDEDEH